VSRLRMSPSIRFEMDWMVATGSQADFKCLHELGLNHINAGRNGLR
jgi:hypothetical protein